MPHHLHELRVELLQLSELIRCLLYEHLKILLVHILCTLRQANKEVVEDFLILILLAEVFLEFSVDLHALVHGLNIVGEHGSEVFVGLVDSLARPLEVLLHALPVAIPLPPHLQLRLEVGESLLDQFDIEQSSHTIRGFHKGVELILKDGDFQKDVTWASRTVSRGNVDLEATLFLLSILLTFQPVDIDAWMESLVSA